MPRYFFDLLDSNAVSPDPSGTVLPDQAACQKEALQRARNVLAEGDKNGEDRSNWAFEVTDEAHRPILIVRFAEAARAG